MARRTHPTRKRSGLTLLEVIISLAIFLFSLVAIGQLMTLGTERATEVRTISRATALAQSKMGEVIAGVLPLSSQGNTPFDHEPDYVWSVDCQQDSVVNLWDVQVRVSRANKEGNGNLEAVLQQMVLDPTARGSSADVMAATDSGTTSSSGSNSSGSSQSGSTAGGGAASASKGGTTGGTTGGATGGTTGAATSGSSSSSSKTGGTTSATTGSTKGG